MNFGAGILSCSGKLGKPTIAEHSARRVLVGNRAAGGPTGDQTKGHVRADRHVHLGKCYEKAPRHRQGHGFRGRRGRERNTCNSPSEEPLFIDVRIRSPTRTTLGYVRRSNRPITGAVLKCTRELIIRQKGVRVRLGEVRRRDRCRRKRTKNREKQKLGLILQ